MSNGPAEPDTVLLVDDTPANLAVLVDYLPRNGLEVLVARSGEQALEQVGRFLPDLILLDVVMPGLDGFETCRRLKADPHSRDVPVIFMTALSDTTDKVRGFEAGAVDYVTKPLQHEEVLARVTTHLQLRHLQSALEEANASLETRVAERTEQLEQALAEVETLTRRLHAENAYLQEEIRVEHHNFREIVGTSRALLEVLSQVETVAPSDGTVLILGETGTGKELIARAVHDRSRRRDRPLVKVNCSAISAGLVESELFGHVKGAFTGASSHRVGRFELADGGTLFLDEIGELPLETQAKLLRVLQEGELEAVGSSKTTRVDVRVVAATNRLLEDDVREGLFRSDLYYRLNVLPIHLPPLRERVEDIPALVDFFIRRFARNLGKDVRGLTPETLDRLSTYGWPGNVRELANLVERAVVLSKGPIVTIGDDALPSNPGPVASDQDGPTRGEQSAAAFPTLAEAESRHISASLARSDGVIEGPQGAARMLGLAPSTLRSRMKRLGIANPGRGRSAS